MNQTSALPHVKPIEFATETMQWGPIGIAIATVPPVLLLATTHVLVKLSQAPRQVPALAVVQGARPVWLARGYDADAPNLAKSWYDNHADMDIAM